ncbi:MAG: hypothetical protein ACOC3V_05485 [bacterium]
MKNFILIFILLITTCVYAQFGEYEDIAIGGGITNTKTGIGMVDFGYAGFYVNFNVEYYGAGFTANPFPKVHFGMGVIDLIDASKLGYDGWIGYDIAPKSWNIGFIPAVGANSYDFVNLQFIFTYRINTNVRKNTSKVSKLFKRKYSCKNRNAYYSSTQLSYWQNK